MKELLFLAHRIPYPPNKGDKIRSFHMLQYLARRYRVHLGTFVDDPDDWRHLPALGAICDRTYFARLKPTWAKVRGLSAFARGAPLTIPYYGDRGLRRWVRDLGAERPIDTVVVFSSAMAQYLQELPAGIRSVVDFVDVDSDKWRQYGRKHRWPLSWLYNREADTLLRYERAQAAAAGASVFVSASEAALFRRLAPEAAARVTHVENGVDVQYFSPDPARPNPYAAGERALVFTGAMDYWANVDAVTWFATEVFPTVRAAEPAAHFYIVGSRPAEAVQRLARLPGVHVTGAVEDVRPYVQHAVVAVAPLRVARGVQNKVLEAMAMGKPVVLTSHALDGLKPWPAFAQLAADTAEAFAQRVLELLHDERARDIGAGARDYVASQYDWQRNLLRLQDVIEAVPAPSESADAAPRAAAS